MNDQNLENFQQLVTQFTCKTLEELKRFGICNEIKYIDHICYRVSSIVSYEAKKRELKSYGILVSELPFNGRPISVFKLNEPIYINFDHYAFSIEFIELPAPKESFPYQEGFEHIEIIPHRSLSSIINKFSEVNFDSKNIENTLNSEISLTTNIGVVKFHNKSLKQIVQEEKDCFFRIKGKIVIIDFDDTIAFSGDLFKQVLFKVFQEKLNITINFSEFKKKCYSTFPKIFAEFSVTDNRLQKEVMTLFGFEWRKVSSELKPFVGVESVISCLYNMGVNIVVWTARDRETTKEFLVKNDLDKFISNVYGYEINSLSKPIADNKLSSLCHNSQVILLGDSISDFQASKNIEAEFFKALWCKEHEFLIDEDAKCETPFEFLNKAISSFFSRHY